MKPTRAELLKENEALKARVAVLERKRDEARAKAVQIREDAHKLGGQMTQLIIHDLVKD